jgi:hypothetical protein
MSRFSFRSSIVAAATAGAVILSAGTPFLAGHAAAQSYVTVSAEDRFTHSCVRPFGYQFGARTLMETRSADRTVIETSTVDKTLVETRSANLNSVRTADKASIETQSINRAAVDYSCLSLDLQLPLRDGGLEIGNGWSSIR